MRELFSWVCPKFVKLAKLFPLQYVDLVTKILYLKTRIAILSSDTSPLSQVPKIDKVELKIFDGWQILTLQICQTYYAVWPSRYGNYIICKTFALRILLRILEVVIHNEFWAQHHQNLVLGSRLKYLIRNTFNGWCSKTRHSKWIYHNFWSS